MRKKLILLGFIVTALACQVVPTPPALTITPRLSPTPAAPIPAATLTAAAVVPNPPGPTPTGIHAPGDLPPFPFQPETPFAPAETPVQLTSQYSGIEPALPLRLDQLANPQVIAGLTLRQQNQLLRDGYVIVPTRDAEFSQVRLRVAECFGQAYYLTTDAAFHALHQTLDELIPILETEELHRRLIAVTQSAFQETLTYLALVEDDRLKADIRQAAAYLGVGLSLLEPGIEIDQEVAEAVEAQASQVRAARGLEESNLISGFRDDFRIYRPSGHYAADPNLQAFYRGMTWFSRAAIPLDRDRIRTAVILTLALRRAQIDPDLLPNSSGAGGTAADEWSRVYETQLFLRGPGPGMGPGETAALMDQVYPLGVTIVGLADQTKLEQLSFLAQELPPASYGWATLNPLRPFQPSDGWRWMPLEFYLDDLILDPLEAMRPTTPDGTPLPPSPLEVMIGSGSAPAAAALKEIRPETTQDFIDQIFRLPHFSGTTAIQAGPGQGSTPSAGPNPLWTGWEWSESRLYAAMQAQVSVKDGRYPDSMRAPGWAYKDLNTALGAWVDARREEGNPAPPTPHSPDEPVSSPAPAFVEPNPSVFFELGQLAIQLAEGLANRGLTGVFSPTAGPGDLRNRVQQTLNLGQHLQLLGEIATRELKGSPLTESDWRLIGSPLGPGENRLPGDRRVCSPTSTIANSAAGLALLQTSDGPIHYAATGGIHRIYSLVVIDGRVFAAQGGIYSYYEFPEAKYGPVDTGDWQRLLSFNLDEPPEWTRSLFLPEGIPVDRLLIRPGYVLRITPAGGRISLRAQPESSSPAAGRLSASDIFTVLEGPVETDGLTWWQVRAELEGKIIEGWIVEDPFWYERVW